MIIIDAHLARRAVQRGKKRFVIRAHRVKLEHKDNEQSRRKQHCQEAGVFPSGGGVEILIAKSALELVE
jgi:hypothetical protein